MPTEAEIIANLRRCLSFEKCSHNLCPLDLELHLRKGGTKCSWMREAKEKEIAGKKLIEGGGIMPDKLLKIVPGTNVSWLNEASKGRWEEIRA